ncbi:MAG TPA: TolC family protein [Thermoanaerobaculia bacterium]|nr:TolC family protein [Thermoanaerobaculia bacterium]
MKHPWFFLLFFVSPLLIAQDAPLTIERAVQLAVERNERAAIADTDVEAAEARLRRGRSAFFPRIDVAGNWRADYEQGTDRTLQTSALLTQPLFDARLFPIYRQLRFEREATRLSAHDTRRVLAFDAAITFLTTISLEQVLLAAENRRRFAQTNLDDVRARFEAGLVSSNDVTRAELELANAVRGVAQAAGDVQASRINLETLLKTDVDGPLATPAGLLDAADEPPAATDAEIDAAQQRRSDIGATRARVEALRAFAQEPAARFIPSVLLNAQTRNVNDGPIANRNNEGFVGVTVNWPLLDAGVRSSERAERNALVRGAELELEADLREVEQQMRGSAVQLATEQALLREATAALRAARKNADETSALYREGLASALELADANQRRFEAEVAEVTARYRMAVAYLALREAAGVGAVGENR